jgi:hypothetical protein
VAVAGRRGSVATAWRLKTAGEVCDRPDRIRCSSATNKTPSTSEYAAGAARRLATQSCSAPVHAAQRRGKWGQRSVATWPQQQHPSVRQFAARAPDTRHAWVLVFTGKGA